MKNEALTEAGRNRIGDTAVVMATHKRLSHQTAMQVVTRARTYTWQAIDKLVDLMMGKAGQITVLDKNGNLVVIDIEVPAAVQAKCADILLDRGWGKAPQAILLKSDSPLNLNDGESRQFTVQEKIQMLLQAKLQEGTTVDLEASQLQEAQPEPKHADPVEAELVEEKEDDVLALI